MEAPAAVEGVIIGVEHRTVATSGKEPIEVDVLNLRTESGLQSVRIEQIVKTKIVHPKIDQEFQRALDLLAAAHTNNTKQVKLDFRGAGKRQVSVGYIQEAPVWKTSYRLVVRKDEPTILQGWAIAENTSTQDWREVQLTLVSGRPISFQMELYKPLYLSRPFVTPTQHAKLFPRVYDQDLTPQEGGRLGRERAIAAGGMGGMGGGMGGGYFGGERRVDRGGRDGASLDPTKGVAAAAAAGEVGELFRYAIKAPVTLPHSESAMLPIVNDPVKVEKLSIYNLAVQAKHPLAGLRLTNATDLHLLQGPITLFDGGEYAGDAQIEDIPPGGTRLISYALDQETEISSESTTPATKNVSLQIRKGGLHAKQKITRQQTYLVKNSGADAKNLLIERPFDASWNVTSPKPVEQTANLSRFSLIAAPGKTTQLIVEEEQEGEEEFALATLEPDKLILLLHTPPSTPAMETEWQKLVAKRSNLSKLGELQSDLTAQMAALVRDQERLRGNLDSVGALDKGLPASDENKQANSELIKRYLKKMAEAETAFEGLNERLAAARLEEGKARAELDKIDLDIVLK